MGRADWLLLLRPRTSALAVEMVGLDVVRDAGGEQVGAGVAGFEALAQAGGGYVFVDCLEEVDAGLLRRGEAEGIEITKGEAGPADDDPFGEFEEAGGFVPVREIEKAVGTGEVEQLRVGHELMQGGEGLNGVVGGSVSVRGVEFGYGETRVGDAGEGEHGEAIGVGGGRAVAFERLATYRGEEDAIQMEGVCGGGGDGEMTAMRRVEGSAKERDSHRQFSPDGAEELGLRFRLRCRTAQALP